MTDEEPSSNSYPRKVVRVYTKDSAYVDPASPSDVQRLIVRSEYRKSAWGMALGAVCIMLGALLSILGAAGSITWVVKTEGLESSLYNASPGVALVVAGLAVIFFTRAKFVHKKV